MKPLPAAPPLRAVIVDDEELSRRVIREALGPHPDISIVAECADGFEAVRAIHDLHPDLLFLDIQMPLLNGFEVLELLEEAPAVVFVTAYDTYALRAFEVHAIDYLLKPFHQERFDEALERARQDVGRRTGRSLHAVARAARHPGQPLERILIRDGPRVHVLSVEAIEFIEAQDDYIAIHAGGKRYLKTARLAAVATSLERKRFIQVHRSYVINLEYLARLELHAKENRKAVLKDGTRVPVSRAGYERLKRLL